jgi:hypothetical protein
MELTRVIKDHLLMLQVKSKNKGNVAKGNNKKHCIMEPIKSVPIEAFAEMLLNNCKSLNMI